MIQDGSLSFGPSDEENGNTDCGLGGRETTVVEVSQLRIRYTTDLNSANSVAVLGDIRYL
ncbi:hypothetical protein GA0061084_1035 [Arthrobacter sp. NIO-1057]|nr:hypothetical protein GA0061084_1035 [Arthrobacter sp. NIO-1057]